MGDNHDHGIGKPDRVKVGRTLYLQLITCQEAIRGNAVQLMGLLEKVLDEETMFQAKMHGWYRLIQAALGLSVTDFTPTLEDQIEAVKAMLPPEIQEDFECPDTDEQPTS